MKGNVTTAGGSNSASGSISTIYAKNTTGKEISAGEKVLITVGATSVSEEFSQTYSTDLNYPPIYYDNGKVQVGGSNNTNNYKLLVYENDTWNETGTTAHSDNGIINYNHGVISLSRAPYPTGNADILYDGYNKITIPNNGIYLGKYKDKEYMYSRYNASLNIYNSSTNTKGSELYFGVPVCTTAFRDEDIICCPATTMVRFFKIADDGSVSVISEQSVTNFTALYTTGLKTGEYILTTNDTWDNSNQLGQNQVQRGLIMYQIGENYTLNKVTVPCLERFEYKTSIISYDSRSNLLCVGTMEGIYLFKYENQIWKEIALNIDTSTHNAKYCYRGATSPDGSHLVVQFTTTDNTCKTIIYSIESTENIIVPKYSRYFTSDNSFTGFATGTKTADNNYEVSAILPDILTLTINVTPEPETFEFNGGL